MAKRGQCQCDDSSGDAGTTAGDDRFVEVHTGIGEDFAKAVEALQLTFSDSDPTGTLRAPGM